MPSIKFYCFHKGPNDPSLSGYCQKLETFLRVSGFKDYTLHTMAPNQAPKGKLPYIEVVHDDGRIEGIADSHFIVRHLIENQIVPDPDTNLTAAQRAESRAWQAWIEELIYPTVVYTRWGPPANFAATKAALPIPWYILPLVAWNLRRNILNALWVSGVGRHTDEERYRLLREYAEALEARLEGAEFFHGDEPTMIDMIVYGFIANALDQPGNPEYTALLLGSERLRRYTAVLTRKWFPEYEAVLEMVEKKHVD